MLEQLEKEYVEAVNAYNEARSMKPANVALLRVRDAARLSAASALSAAMKDAEV